MYDLLKSFIANEFNEANKFQYIKGKIIRQRYLKSHRNVKIELIHFIRIECGFTPKNKIEHNAKTFHY